MLRPLPLNRIAALAVLGLATPSCVPTLGSTMLREPELALPARYERLPARPPEKETPPEAAALTPEAFFDDPALNALIEVALAENRELSAQFQAQVIAESEILARSGEYLPRGSVIVGAGVEKVGERTSQGASDEALGLAENLRDFRLGLSVSWEVDVWNRLRTATKAAAKRYLATVEGRKFLITQLVSEIATEYYELLALDAELRVLDESIVIQSNALEVVRLEKAAARVTELAVQRFEAEVLENRSRRSLILQRIVEAENRLNVLLGHYPQPIARDGKNWPPRLPASIGSGAPRELLENRPDVRMAELNLEAAALDVDVARASFYPALGIDGDVGLESFDAGKLVTPSALFYGLGARIVGPLINRRSLTADYLAAGAERLRAVLEYEQVVLQAVSEVTTELSRVKNLQDRASLLTDQVKVLESAVKISGTLFQNARADYMEVLLTRRDYLAARLEMVEARLNQSRASVRAYRALGGGWRQPNSPAEEDEGPSPSR